MQNREYDTKAAVGHLVGNTFRELAKQLQRRFHEAGQDITYEQWVLLLALLREDGLSQGQIARATHKDKTAITRLCDGMEKRALIVRIQDKQDARLRRIYLTRKGKALENELLEISTKTLNDAVQEIDDHQLDVAKTVLSKMYSNLSRL